MFSGLTATAQHNYPRYFQQVNRGQTNRFTTGGALSFRYLNLIDSLQNDTISILPSSYQNVFWIAGSADNPDSLARDILINSNNANAYLNDEIWIYAPVSYLGSFTIFGSTWDGPHQYILLYKFDGQNYKLFRNISY